MKLPQISQKLTLLVTVTLLTTATAQSQRRAGEAASDKGGKPRIVVLATGSNSTMWTTNVTTATLEDVITQSGRFELIAGAQREQLFKEQGFNNSQLVDPQQATKVGKLLSARYIIVGNALDITSSKRKNPLNLLTGRNEDIGSDIKSKVQIQMIDAETGVVTISKSYEQKITRNTVNDGSEQDSIREGYRKAMESIATQFAAEFATSVPTEGLVVLVRNGRVAIDLGSEQVKVGQTFEVYSQDEPIKSATGEILSYITTKYALLQIAEVEPKLSWATVIKTFDPNGTPDVQIKLERIQQKQAVRLVKSSTQKNK
jgi:TolB-like protein